MGLEDIKNILIVHNYYQIPGGEDTVVENEKTLLETHGHNVVLYTRSNSELSKMRKVSKLLLPITTIFNPRTYKDIKSFIVENKIDVIHVHNTLNLISPSVYYAARVMKVPVVQTVHNFRLICPGATLYRDGHICEDCLRYGLKCSVKHSCYRGSKIQTLACALTLTIHRIMGIYKKINYICLTEFTKDKIKSVVDLERVYIKPNFVYDQKGLNQADDYYIFVGRVEEIKGVNVLVDAFRSMPNKKLKIVGRGDLSERIAARLERESIHNIQLLGFKSHDEVNALLKHAKALIMCSQWYETFGMVIAEAYSNGVPAIVGRIGNIKDLVDESVTGELFTYDDPKDLIAAVERFESKPQADYSKNAYDFYCRNLTGEKNYITLRTIYEQVKGGR